MAFQYYKRLSAKDKRTYRRSDAVSDIDVPGAERIRPIARSLERALASEDRAAVQRAAQSLLDAVTRALAVRGVKVRVLARRPKDHESELHGLYTLEADGRAHIQVWMRTAEQRRVVMFRTFLRTLLHELCHHLDFVHLELAETFHTDGFFRRESSLFRKLCPPAERQPKQQPAATAHPVGQARPSRRQHDDPRQLSLF